MFEVFKTVKIALKNLNKGKCKQYENEEFEAFEKFLSSYYTFFPIDKSRYCLTRFC